MAKMFYTIEETAQTLGISAEQVKDLATSGKLQQFRDRDKLMFKRDQVDNLVGKVGAADSSGSQISLAPEGRKGDPREGTGMNVFEADEVEPADPMAQTQITKHAPGDQPEEGEVTLESVGSGSGLLDLTRESDDTSLGAELLDEIYPAKEGEGQSGDSLLAGQTGAGATGVMESVLGAEGQGQQPSGTAVGAGALAELGGGDDVTPTAMPVTMMAEEAYDPAGSGMSLGFLIGATVALVVLLIVVANSLTGIPSAMVTTIAKSMGTLMIYAGGLLLVSIILGLIGFFIGKAKA